MVLQKTSRAHTTTPSHAKVVVGLTVCQLPNGSQSVLKKTSERQNVFSSTFFRFQTQLTLSSSPPSNFLFRRNLVEEKKVETHDFHVFCMLYQNVNEIFFHENNVKKTKTKCHNKAKTLQLK